MNNSLQFCCRQVLETCQIFFYETHIESFSDSGEMVWCSCFFGWLACSQTITYVILPSHKSPPWQSLQQEGCIQMWMKVVNSSCEVDGKL
jgi:hypothetical protein